MSLIQQALKRKQDEQQGTASPPPPPLPSAPLASPPPVTSPLISGGAALTPPTTGPRISLAQTVARTEPAAPLPPHAIIQKPEQQRSPARWPLVLLLLLLMGGAAIWYFRFYKPAHDGSATTANSGYVGSVTVGKTPPAAPSVAKGQPDGKYTQVPSVVPLPNIGAVHEKVDKMKEAITEFRKEASAATGIAPVVAPPPKVEPAPVVAVPKPAPVVAAPAPVVPAPPAPEPAPVVLKPSAPVTWPTVKITGVMATSQKDRRTAFINDSLLNVGDSVDGMVLIDVAENSVTMEFKGERRQIPVGRRR